MTPETLAALMLIEKSHLQMVGSNLARIGAQTLAGAAWLHEQAPFGLLAQGIGANPRFFYANDAALRVLGYTRGEFLGLSPRSIVAPDQIKPRQAVLEIVKRDGFMSGYEGVRVRKSGQPFRICNGCIWRLVSDSGKDAGLAASWDYRLDED